MEATTDTTQVQPTAPAKTVAEQAASVDAIRDARQSAAMGQRETSRAQRRASAMAKVVTTHVDEPAGAGATQILARVEPQTEAKPTDKTTDTAKTEPVKTEAQADKPDPVTQRGLAQVERAQKKFLEEQAAWKAERSIQEAEIARLREQATGKVTSLGELKKVASDTPSLLDKLELSDAQLLQLSHEAYARTSKGQADPQAKANVDEIRRRQSLTTMESRYSELADKLKSTEEKLDATNKLIFQREYANKYLDKVIAEVPADKPSLFGKLMAKDAERARTVLGSVAAELEKTNEGEQPTAAEVLAEYERQARVGLESLGIDVDGLLTQKTEPVKQVAKTAQRSQTLDVTATKVTREAHVPKTREERRAAAQADLRMRQRNTADQVS